MRLSFKPIILMIILFQFFYLGGIARIINDANTGDQDEHPLLMKELQDIHDKRVGVLLGSIHDVYAHKHFPDAEILQYNNVSDMLFAVNSEKVDAVFVGKVALVDILKKNPELGVLASDIYFVDIAAGFNRNNDALREQFNRFLKELRDKGIYKEMIDRWMNSENPVMPEIVNTSTTGVLRVGVVSDIGLPFIIIQNGKLAGFDIELSSRFAAWLGKKYEPLDMQFGSLIASISTNKIDIITSSMSVTPERVKQINFSDPYYASGAIVIARKDHISVQDTSVAGKSASAGNKPSHVKSFLEKTSESFYNNILFEKRYLLILNGLRVTLEISLLSALLGTLIGALICLMRMSKARPVSNIARFIINLIRGVPVLVLLMIIFYVIFASININPILAAVIAFGLNFGAYASEIFRSGIESIDPGQNESALASGFTRFQSFRYIVMPQALRPILPVYKGEFISLLKMTSIVGYLAVQDLTKASDIIRSRTFDAFFPLIMVAILYFTLAWLLTLALDYFEISLYPKSKQNRS